MSLFDKPLSAKRRESLARRLSRIGSPSMERSVSSAVESFRALSFARYDLMSSFRIRLGFAYLNSVPAGSSASDRRLPDADARPPATRIVTSRGAALRLELTALALAQARASRAGVRLASIPVRAQTRSERGWVDLIASPTQRPLAGRVSISELDKRQRHVQTALRTLAAAGLVELPAPRGTKTVFDGFVLGNEEGPGSRADAGLIEYRVPTLKEHTFAIPAAVITQGWVHVLEDSEINLLLMIACGQGTLPDPTHVAVPGDVRLLQYGIGRDSYSNAHATLKDLGLIEVVEVGRHEDGRVIEYGKHDGEAHVHRLRLLLDGFGRPAHATLVDVLRERCA